MKIMWKEIYDDVFIVFCTQFFTLYEVNLMKNKMLEICKSPYHSFPIFFFVTTNQTWNHLGTSYFMLIV